jgi:hypothetical protein
MPDPIPVADQIQALTDQLAILQGAQKRIDGDLNRRFEQLKGSIDQQGTNLQQSSASLKQALIDLAGKSVSHKVSLPFTPALDRDWLEGTSSPPVSVFPFGQNLFIARGNLAVDLPNLSRIEAFRATVNITNVLPASFNLISGLQISLQRTSLTANNSEPIVELGLGFLFTQTGIPLQNAPIPGRELVDNDLFKYFISAVFTMMNPGPFQVVAQKGMVVLNSFQVDCIEG